MRRIRPQRGLNRKLPRVLFATLVFATVVGGVLIAPVLKDTDYLEQGNMSPKESKEVMKAGNRKAIVSKFSSPSESDLLEGIEYENSNTEPISLEGVSYEKTLNFKDSTMKIYLDENGAIVDGIAFKLDRISDKDLEIIKTILNRSMDSSQQVIDLMLATLDKFKIKVDDVEKRTKTVETYKLGNGPTSITITPEYTSSGNYKNGVVQIFNSFNLEQPLGVN